MARRLDPRPWIVLGGVGLIVLTMLGLFGQFALATLVVDATPPVIIATEPSGTGNNPDVVAVGQPYTVYVTVGEDSNLLSGGGPCTATPQTNCERILIGTSPNPSGAWTAGGGVLWQAGTVVSPCNLSGALAGITCTPNIVSLPSSSCGGQTFCTQFQLQLTPLPSSLAGVYVSIAVAISDIAGNSAQIQFGQKIALDGVAAGYMILTTGSSTFKFCNTLVSPTGCIGTSGTIVTSSLTQNFSFNATSIPTAITLVQVTIAALSPASNTGTGTYCIVGTIAGCVNAPYSGFAANFYFPNVQAVTLGNGQYNVTAFMTVGTTQYRILSVLDGFGTGAVTVPLSWFTFIAGLVLIIAPFLGYRRRRKTL